MGRQVFMTFFGKARSEAAGRATESPAVMTVPLVRLAVLSVIGGASNLPGVDTLDKWLAHTLGEGLTIPFSWVTALLSLGVALLGLFLAWNIYSKRTLINLQQGDPLAHSLGNVFVAMQHKWWVDEIYQFLFVKPYQFFSEKVLSEWADQELIDGAVNDSGGIVRFLAKSWCLVQNGFVRSYALVFLLGVVIMLAYLVFK
jgi:NADH-quinone oxidoreductase subunit L